MIRSRSATSDLVRELLRTRANVVHDQAQEDVVRDAMNLREIIVEGYEKGVQGYAWLEPFRFDA
jgi:hypothetical protein